MPQHHPSPSNVETIPESAAPNLTAGPGGAGGHRRRHWLRWILATVALVVVFGWAFVSASRLGKDPSLVESPLIGSPAPAFVLNGLDGESVNSSEFAGRVWVVNFWASWCVPCREEAPHLESFYRRWSPQDVGMVGIVYNDAASDAREFRDEFGLTYPQAMDPDGRLAIDFGVFGVPETFVIDERGVVMAKLIGAVGPDTLDNVLASVMAGEQVTDSNDRYQTSES